MASDGTQSELLFSFSTLQPEAVQLATFGRRLTGSSDALEEFELVSLTIEDQSVVEVSEKAHHTMARFTGRASDLISGTVYDPTADGIESADPYEVPAVRRVAVVLKSKRRAWVYVDAQSTA